MLGVVVLLPPHHHRDTRRQASLVKHIYTCMFGMQEGNRRRKIEATDANAASSRSHAILEVTVCRSDRNHYKKQACNPKILPTLLITIPYGSRHLSASPERLLIGSDIFSNPEYPALVAAKCSSPVVSCSADSRLSCSKAVAVCLVRKELWVCVHE